MVNWFKKCVVCNWYYPNTYKIIRFYSLRYTMLGCGWICKWCTWRKLSINGRRGYLRAKYIDPSLRWSLAWRVKIWIKWRILLIKLWILKGLSK